MAAKFFLVICMPLSTALFVQAISSQCLRGSYDAGIIDSSMIADGINLAANNFAYGSMTANTLAYDTLAAGYGPGTAYGNIAPASNRGFRVTSSSPIAPAGISITSENAIEGILAVNGELPVLAAVALEGALPTAGSGSIVYGCGNGAIGIVSEGVESFAAPASKQGYENALAAELGYGNQFSGRNGYGATLAAGLGSRGLAGVGPVVGPRCGCGI